MKIRKYFSIMLVAVCAIAVSAQAQMTTVGDGGPGPVKAQHLTAELVTLGQTIAPGSTLQAGLVLTMEQHWHVYWLNPGDAGEPPHIKWTLPAGLTVGPMLFPAPSRLPLGPLMNYGYEDTVAYPFTFTASPKMKPGQVHVDALTDWIVCAEVCIPGKAHLGLSLTVGPAGSPIAPAGALGEALSLIPKPLPADAQVTVTGGKKQLAITLKSSSITNIHLDDVEFYPIDEEQVANAADQDVTATPDGFQMRVTRADEKEKLPKELHGLLKLSDTESYEFTAAVVPGVVEAAPVKQAAASGVTTLGAIGLAFLGGIILNLMPCVFPVLFLKGLALVQSSGEERKQLRSHGLVYTLGILVSFWAIVGVLLVLRAGGSQAGWGFQLQSPAFIVVLASFIFFFALSLAGMFDIGLSLTSAGGSLAAKEGYAGSFFTGVLATVVATPCTAPLMGAAIGFALVQPAWITFAIFTALALGLAIPYLLLSFQPAWTKILPRPGAWMEVLKQLTAVPLFGTAIWLAYVYGSLNSGGVSDPGEGVYKLSLLLVGFLVLAIAGWVLGKWPAKWGSFAAAVALIAVALAVPLYQPKDTNLVWAPYSQAALDAARKDGRPVFIDFTAAWCLSCQVNEKLVLHAADVQKQLSERNVVLLRADWTKYDPEITKELASLGRSGVPTYVLYPVSESAAPDVLPEVLTKDLVLDAIKRDAGK